MTDRLSLGYREARAATGSPLAEEGDVVRGHEFHYSAVEPRVGALPSASPAWEFAGRGEEGFVSRGVCASYLHTHWAATPGLARRFVRSGALGRARLAGARA